MFAVWRVDVDQIKIWEFGGNNATFVGGVAVLVGVLGVADIKVVREAVKDAERLFFSKNGSAGITWASGGVPELFVFG